MDFLNASERCWTELCFTWARLHLGMFLWGFCKLEDIPPWDLREKSRKFPPFCLGRSHVGRLQNELLIVCIGRSPVGRSQTAIIGDRKLGDCRQFALGDPTLAAPAPNAKQLCLWGFIACRMLSALLRLHVESIISGGTQILTSEMQRL